MRWVIAYVSGKNDINYHNHILCVSKNVNVQYQCSCEFLVSVNGSNNELCTGGAHTKSERQKWNDITSCMSPLAPGK